jgi:hypothetical protein
MMQGTLFMTVTVSAAAALSALLFPSTAPGIPGMGFAKLFAPPEPSFFVPRVHRRILPAACLVAAGIAALGGDELIASILCGVFAAFLASRLTGSPTAAVLRRRAMISTATAVICTSIALARYAMYGRGGVDGLYAGGSSVETQTLQPQKNGEGAGDAVAEQGDSAALGGDYSGVILWPEAQAATMLVPPLPAMRPNLFDSRTIAEPLSIPFFGVYWMYRRPHRQPPRNSFTTKGDPAKVSFRSVDRVPLLMEARQNLGKMIDARCCREVRLALRNSDRYPGTLSLELLLVNSDARQPMPLSLGRAPVTSSPHWSRIASQPAQETLAFQVPPRPVPDRFDEFRVVFHRSNFGIDRSARIAIDRFILVRR